MGLSAEAATASMSTQDEVIEAYEQGRNDVYHYMLRLGLDPARAQEISQEVFLRLFLALQRGQEIRNKRAWLFRVAHNLGIDSRREGKRWQVLDDTLAASLHDRRPGPDAGLIAGERTDAVKQALDSLSPQQRQCLHLRAEGLRYREIAEAIGIGVSTVGEFLNRAVTRLRKAANE
jgi:RNA polymerase sigma-70 factor (ECF subfamily)